MNRLVSAQLTIVLLSFATGYASRTLGEEMPKLDHLFPLGDDTTWTYEMVEDGEQHMAELRLKKRVYNSGKVEWWLTRTIDGREETQEAYMPTAEGLVRTKIGDLTLEPAWLILPKDMKPNWSSEQTIQAGKEKAQVANKLAAKSEEVVTPLGTYEAWKLSTTLTVGDDWGKVNYWLAEGMGIVKWEFETPKRKYACLLKDYMDAEERQNRNDLLFEESLEEMEDE